MVKTFIYCESTYGGLDTGIIQIKESENYKTNFTHTHKIETLSCISDIELPLYRWMKETNEKKDKELLDWLKIAKIGDYFEHRLGVCFRVTRAEEGSHFDWRRMIIIKNKIKNDKNNK